MEMSSMPKQETLGAGLARLSKAAERTRLLSETRIEWELYENRLLRLNGAGACVTCLEGLVLITAYDQPEDITLSAGEVFIVPNDGLALIESIGYSRVHIALPRAGIFLSREGVMRMLKGIKISARLA
jgi:hypothetical protein